MHQIFPSTFFNFEFLRLLGTAPYLGAETGECLATAARIKDGDPESWYHAWYEQAQKALALADEAKAVGDGPGAAWGYIRASNYFRASEFLLHCTPEDPRILSSAVASADAFDKGWILLDGSVRKVDIPYEGGKTLPGRLYLPALHHQLSGKIPVVIQTGGFDSTQEELYYYGAAGALPRGYAVFSFDGPGQGLSLRKDKLYLRPDWEHVTSKVLDHVIGELAPAHNLDVDRLAMFGASLGGYLSLRAAADPRVKAVVSCDGPLDLFDITRSRMPPWFINGWLSGWLSDGFFNWVIDRLASVNFQLAWEFGHSKWVYGVKTPADVMRTMQKFSLKDGYLSKIKCPTLITGAADSFYFTPQQNAHPIFDSLSALGPAEKHLWIGKGGVEGGGLQAKIGALALMHYKMFAWLDETFGIRRDEL